MPILPPPSKLQDLEVTSDPGLEYFESQKTRRHTFAASCRRAEIFLDDHAKHPEKYPKTKRYALADEIALKPNFGCLEKPLVGLLAKRKTSRKKADRLITLEDIATLLMGAYGLQRYLPGADPQRNWQRTLASPGGLFPSEIYYWSIESADLPRGLYHFNPERASLEILPFEGPTTEITRYVTDLVPSLPRESPPDLSGILFVTSVFDRLRKKYGHRYLRFCLLEAGAICHGLDLVSTALNIGLWHQGALEDHDACELLRIDGITEALVYATMVMGRHS